MNYLELIRDAAVDAFKGGAELGVRLSNLSLSSAQVDELSKLARGVLEFDIYLAISSSGAPSREDERVCVSQGERAAERATEWRNTIDPKEGERVIYISSQALGKEGGLLDTLYPLSEDALRGVYFAWLEGPGAARFPDGFVAAFKSARFSRALPVARLTAFSESLQLGETPLSEAEAWAYLGHQLPELGLARDSKLNAQSAAARLTFNARFVRRAATGERRGLSLTGAEAWAAFDRLNNLFKQPGRPMTELLREIDIGDLDAKLKPPKRRRGRRKKRVKGGEGLTNAGHAGGRRKPQPATPGVGARGLDPDEAPPIAEAPQVEPAPSPLQETAPVAEDAPRRPVAWSASKQRAEFDKTFEPLPAGLAALLQLNLSAQGGAGVTWESDAACPRLSLDELSPSTRDERCGLMEAPEGVGELQALIDARGAAREELRGLLSANERGHPLIDRYVYAPLMVLSEHPQLRDALERFLIHSAALCERAEALDVPALSAYVLSLETVTIQAGARRLCLIGPLHPLALGQALARVAQLERDQTLSANTQRVLARALKHAPLAPRLWPGAPEPLARSAPYLGLIIYETDPDEVAPAELFEAGRALLAKYIQAHPFARVGVEIAVDARAPAPLLNGFACAIDELDEEMIGAVKVYLCQQGAPLDPRAREAVERGVMRLSPLEGALIEQDVNIQVSLKAPNAPEYWTYTAEVPPQHSVSTSQRAHETSFVLGERGLIMETDISALSGVREAARLCERLRGRAPRDKLISALEALNPQAIFPRSPPHRNTWQVVIGARLAKTQREDSHLLIHERVGETCEVSVVTGSVDAVVEELRAPFHQIGVTDLGPSGLKNLTVGLIREGAQGITSLEHDNDQRVAAATLALQMRVRRGDRVGVSALLTGTSAMTLLGEARGAFMVGVWREGADALGVCVGYAALSDALDVTVSEASRPTGPLIDKLRRLGELITNATGADNALGVHVTREALRWLLMPPVMARLMSRDDYEELRYGGLKAMLERLGEVSVTLEGVCLLPLGHQALSVESATVNGIQTRFCALDQGLFEELLLEAQSLS